MHIDILFYLQMGKRHFELYYKVHGLGTNKKPHQLLRVGAE